MSAVPKNFLLTHVHNNLYVIIRYAITSNVKKYIIKKMYIHEGFYNFSKVCLQFFSFLNVVFFVYFMII